MGSLTQSVSEELVAVLKMIGILIILEFFMEETNIQYYMHAWYHLQENKNISKIWFPFFFVLLRL